jgi:hypothetical protein
MNLDSVYLKATLLDLGCLESNYEATRLTELA